MLYCLSFYCTYFTMFTSGPETLHKRRILCLHGGGVSAKIFRLQAMVNVVAFVHDPNDWPLEGRMDVPASREEVVNAFAEWGPAVRGMIDLLPDQLTKWAIFDTYDHPAPFYSRGRVCLAGSLSPNNFCRTRDLIPSHPTTAVSTEHY